MTITVEKLSRSFGEVVDEHWTRGVLLGYEIASVPFNLAVLLAFTVVMLVLAIWMSGKEV
jgi:hypothetical protein